MKEDDKRKRIEKNKRNKTYTKSSKIVKETSLLLTMAINQPSLVTGVQTSSASIGVCFNLVSRFQGCFHTRGKEEWFILLDIRQGKQNYNQ